MCGGSPSVIPNRVHAADATVLVGWLAEIEGALTVGDLPERVVVKLRQRVVSAGLLAEDGSERDLRQAINDLNQRLRYGLGEYPDPPEQMPVP